MAFSKILQLSEKGGFLSRQISAKLNYKLLKIESTGTLLKENLKNEWFNDVVINRYMTVFLNDQDINRTFDFAKNMCLGLAPFGIAEYCNKANTSSTLRDLNNLVDSTEIDFSNYFEDEQILKCHIFVTPSNSLHFFHQWQRQRRMWWRKLSASPGRYSLTDLKVIPTEKTQTVEILAKYPWGEQCVEKLSLVNNNKQIDKDKLQIKDGRKVVTLDTIISEVHLFSMLLNFLCDAYDEQVQDNPKPLFRLHRKLAPYKISFAISAPSTSVSDDLYKLALHLCKQLRLDHVSFLLTPASYKLTLEAQWKQYDELGIPYVVHLNENTLKNGVVLLRNRDTTLKEQLHVTDLQTYINQLFKNY